MRIVGTLLGLAIALFLRSESPAYAQSSVHVDETSVSLLDALRTALEKSPNIRIGAAQVSFDRGSLQIAASQFDRVYRAGFSQSRTNAPITSVQLGTQDSDSVGRSQIANLTTYELGAVQLMRNGVSFGPVVDINRQTDNIVATRGVSASNIRFQVVVPLLRGRGREVVAAGERSAQLNLNAALYELNQTIARQLTSVANAYWNVSAARRNLEIARSSEDRGLNYASMVRTLIEADRLPKIDMNNVTANVSQRTTERLAAEAVLYGARQQLALAIGLSAPEITVFPNAIDEMPDGVTAAPLEVTAQTIARFVDRAIHRRADMLAAEERYKSREALAPAARNQLRPQLDVTIALGYQSALEGREYLRPLATPFTNVGGPSAIFGLQYSLPPARNAARGVVAQTEAQITQARLEKNDISRRISSEVASAMTSLALALARMRSANEAVIAARLALDGENQKFRLGRNSLVDLLTVEDRLTTTLRAENSARLDYSLVLANLRYATGTVVEPAANTQTIDQTLFKTAPFEWSK